MPGSDSGSLPVGSPDVEIKLFCVAEFRRHDLAINYVLPNPHRRNLAAERLSEELTPLLQRLAELDPEIGA